MKKRILVVLSFALALSANLRAQVTIGELVEPTAGAILDLNKAVKGGLALSVVDLPNFQTIPNGFPGIASQADVTPAVKSGFRGALVYNTGVTTPPTGIYVWNGTNWTPPTDNCLPAENLTLSLTASSSAPAVNTPDTFTVSSDASKRCANGETYTWSVSPATGVTILNTSGATASIQFTTAGAYTVKAEAHNSYSTGSTSVETTVLAGGVVPAGMKTSGYYLTGKPCYDINKTATYDTRAETTAPARVATATNLSVPANRTRTYKFCHENYTNLVISLLEDNGGLVKSISQPDGSDQTGTPNCKTFTVTFKDNVESLVTGAGYSVKLLASYINKNDQAKLADMDISVQDGLCGCPAKIANTGAATDWLTFACHDLGGEDILTGNETITQAHHGDWYRFGVATASLLNVPETPTGSITNWTSTSNSDYPFQNDSQDWLPANNPCPAGWRVPDYNEFAALISTSNNSWTNVPGTWGSEGNTQFGNLKKVGDYLYLLTAGLRRSGNGSLDYRGERGFYWSSNDSNDGSNYLAGRLMYLAIWGQDVYLHDERAYGHSVRYVAVE